MPPASLPLSVVIIALNEERRIGACLDSVRELTDDVVVVDAHSTDCTCQICHAKGARVFQRPWCGYSAQKNFGNAQARHDWVLSLDADERVSPELAASLRREFARGLACDAYTIRFQNYFGAKRVRFGAWNPEWHVRLFDRRRIDWNADEVHEGLRGADDCTIGRLSGCIQHHTVESRAELAAKMTRYGGLFAAKYRLRGREPGWVKVWLNPAWRFYRDYVLRLGLLDGTNGFAIAWEAARYTHLKYGGALGGARWPVRRAWMALGAAATLAALLAVTAATRSSARVEAKEPPTVSAMDEDGGMSHATLPNVGDDVTG